MSMSTASKTTFHLIDIRTLHRMIGRIRRRLIQNIRRRFSQLHPISLKSQITHPRNIVSIIILHKQRQTLHLSKQGSLNLYILDFRGLGEVELLGRRQVCCGGEINVVAVDEHFEGLGS